MNSTNKSTLSKLTHSKIFILFLLEIIVLTVLAYYVAPKVISINELSTLYLIGLALGSTLVVLLSIMIATCAKLEDLRYLIVATITSIPPVLLASNLWVYAISNRLMSILTNMYVYDGTSARLSSDPIIETMLTYRETGTRSVSQIVEFLSQHSIATPSLEVCKESTYAIGVIYERFFHEIMCASDKPELMVEMIEDTMTSGFYANMLMMCVFGTLLTLNYRKQKS